MAYNLEKYRTKREKVLGVKKRGINFGTIATLVSLAIVLGLGTVVVPKSVAFFSTRHLDDAIYKLQDTGSWPHGLLPEMLELSGVKNVVTDSDGARIVVTFDKSITDTDKLSTFFDQKGIATVMLNRIGHNQRMTAIKKEAAF
jgi:hypothetical protein